MPTLPVTSYLGKIFKPMGDDEDDDEKTPSIAPSSFDPNLMSVKAFLNRRNDLNATSAPTTSADDLDLPLEPLPKARAMKADAVQPSMPPAANLAAASDGPSTKTVVRYTEKASPVVAKLPNDEAKTGTTPGGSKPDALEAALDAYKQRRMVDDPSWITKAFEGASAGLALRKPDYSTANQISGMYREKVNEPLNDAKLAESLDAMKRQKALDEALLAYRQAKANPATKAAAPTSWQMRVYEDMNSGDPARMQSAKDFMESMHPSKPATPGARTSPMSEGQQKNYELRREDLRMKKEGELAKVFETYNDPIGIIKEAEDAFPGVTQGKLQPDTEVPDAAEMTVARFQPFGLDVGSHLASDKAVKMRNIQNRIEALLGKKDSGLVLNEFELKRLKSFLGSGAGATPEQFQDAMQIILRGSHRGFSERVAPYRGDGDLAVYDSFLKKSPGAITPEDPIFNAARGAASTPTKDATKAPPLPVKAAINDNTKPPDATRTAQVTDDKGRTIWVAPDDPRLNKWTREGSGFKVTFHEEQPNG